MTPFNTMSSTTDSPAPAGSLSTLRKPFKGNRIRRLLAICRRDESGVSAVEFALFAPILFFGLVALADIGVALFQRMTIDHILRSAAQSAMADQGTDAVLKVLQTTAANNFELASETADPQAISLAVNRYCACPEDTNAAVACSSTCHGSSPTFIYYRLVAEKKYAGMLLPSFNLIRTFQVQVR